VTTARQATALRWPDLCWSHFSRPRFGGFDERIAAAAGAGFAAIGLYLYEYERLLRDEGRTDASLVAQLDAHGLCVGEIEAIRGWWAVDGEQHTEFERGESLAFAMADGIGARYLQAIGPYDCSFEQAVDGFGRLCRRGAEHGLLVGVEWLPFTNIPDADSARRLVEATGCDNAGYCADIWHHVRGANDEAMLRALPGDRIFAVQMNDGPLRPVLADYKDDCLATRLPPGEGEFDCVAFVRILRDLGVTAPISLEVASTVLWALSADETARRAADGMRSVLTAVDG
jgi:sugar phosphate isomerase/epimerase